MQCGPKAGKPKTKHWHKDTERLHREGAQRRTRDCNDQLGGRQQVKSSANIGRRASRQTKEAGNADVLVAAP